MKGVFASRILPVPLGILLGLLASLWVLGWYDSRMGRQVRQPRGALLSDCDGALLELVIHYRADAASIVGRAYHDFLGHLSGSVTVHVVCSDLTDFQDLQQRIGPTACRLCPVVVDHIISTWSRDRWLALGPRESELPMTLLCPRGEKAASVWPARAGDQKVGEDLALALAPRVACLGSDLLFDGGDFVADDETVFVTPDVLRRNLQQTVIDREELMNRLSDMLQRRIVLLDEAPDHHAGMFMMMVGERTVLVGDPGMAKDLSTDSLFPGTAPDFTAETQSRFDAVARQCRAAGYRVVSIPIVPGRDGRTYLTPLNVMLEERAGRRIVYMPVYDGADPINQAAARVWKNLGYEVHEVNCTATYPHFGSLRCLVNVLRRGS